MVLRGRRSAKGRMAKVEKMKNKTFLILLTLITAFGLFLRLIDYDKVPPPEEDFDELHYAWGGSSWIVEGTPRSWSYLSSYEKYEYIESHGIRWRIVSPLIEKPPFYFLLNGVILNFLSKGDIFSIEHNKIRILPIALGTVSIFLTGVVAAGIITKQVGLLAAFLYSIVPTIVLANRMNVTEALLTPFALLITYFLTKLIFVSRINLLTIVIGIISSLAVLTKQIGLAFSLSAFAFFLLRRQWGNIFIILGFVILSFGLIFLVGWIYDIELFFKLTKDLRVHTLAGLPETILSIFRYPGISAKNRPFYDGTILASWILLFTAGFWINSFINDKNKEITKSKTFLLLILPFAFLSLMALGESGSGAFNYFGRYVFPLFPYLMVVFALFIFRIWTRPGFFEVLFLLLFVGSSTIRFLFLNFPRQYHYLWQYSLLLLGILLLVFWPLGLKVRRILLLFYFLIFVLINLIVDFRLLNLYGPSVEQSQRILELFK